VFRRRGYAIMQAVEASAGATIPSGPGTIYGSLHRMEDAGLVRELTTRGDSRRRVFGLQPAGRRRARTDHRRPRVSVGVSDSRSVCSTRAHVSRIGGSAGEDVAVLSYGRWQRRYGGDPNAVGRTVTLDRRPYAIVGVMPASFQFPKRGAQVNNQPAQVWTPLALSPFERSQQARGMMYNHTVIGRLRNGVAPEQAISEAGALASSLVGNYPPILQQHRGACDA
jgi:hypothetical protein